MKANFKMVFLMEREFNFIVEVMFMKDNIKKETNKGKEDILSKMVENMKVILKMDKDMEKVYILRDLEVDLKELSHMENLSLGLSIIEMAL